MSRSQPGDCASRRADKLREGVDVKTELGELLDREPSVDRVELNRRLRRRCEAARLQLYTEDHGSLSEPSVTDILPFVAHVRYGSALKGSDADNHGADEAVRRAEALAGATIDDFVRRLRTRLVHDVGSRHYVLDEPLRRPRGDLSDGDIPRRYVL